MREAVLVRPVTMTLPARMTLEQYGALVAGERAAWGAFCAAAEIYWAEGGDAVNMLAQRAPPDVVIHGAAEAVAVAFKPPPARRAVDGGRGIAAAPVGVLALALALLLGVAFIAGRLT
ncbi:MAG: hypothetical protein NW200_13935 [Hyphomonadaceae bacterium]|nr:hypothetical protein [Hyphomonadaceae bacterium]